MFCAGDSVDARDAAKTLIHPILAAMAKGSLSIAGDALSRAESSAVCLVHGHASGSASAYNAAIVLLRVTSLLEAGLTALRAAYTDAAQSGVTPMTQFMTQGMSYETVAACSLDGASTLRLPDERMFVRVPSKLFIIDQLVD